MAIEAALNGGMNRNNLEIFKPTYGLNFDRLNVFPDERLVLKLHGSANWVHCQECKQFSEHRDDYILPSSLVSRRAEFHNEIKCNSTNRFINVIIPPTWNKLNYVPEITKVWYKSIEEISLATHLFIIGYSFPRTDIFFDQLIGLALRSSKNLKKVVIINPAKEVQVIVKDFFEKHFLDNRVNIIPLKFQELHHYWTKPIENRKNMDDFIKELASPFVNR